MRIILVVRLNNPPNSSSVTVSTDGLTESAAIALAPDLSWFTINFSRDMSTKLSLLGVYTRVHELSTRAYLAHVHALTGQFPSRLRAVWVLELP